MSNADKGKLNAFNGKTESQTKKQMKTRTEIVRAAMALVALGGFGLARPAVAVVPAPDGGYPGSNTAEGQNALLSLNVATGTNNTAVGFSSLKSNVGGQFNTALGAGTLFNNTAHRNTAIGGAAMFSNTTGSFNTAVGMLSLFTNTIGSSNTAMGDGALLSNLTGSFNTAIGRVALLSNTDGSGNTASGAQALDSNTTGNHNTAYGYQTLLDNITGYENTAVGVGALSNNTTGYQNAATGAFALHSNAQGEGNTAAGWHALYNNTSGGNTGIGFGALFNNTTGGLNIALGANTGGAVTTASNVIVIGTVGANVSNSCYIGNIWNQPGGSQAVYVNSNGKIGAQVSSRRFKDEVTPLERASEAIYALKPVSFRYKAEVEPTRPRGFGLIAENVEKVSPDLVTRDSDGKVNSVRYDAINAMLLNEFLKEHKKVQELKDTVTKQEASIADQRKDFETAITQQRQQIQILTAQLKEQAAQIQSVSAQVHLRKALPQTVLNNQ
jgi:hypothetical protein